MIDKDAIKATRQLYRWTQDQLAEYLGLDRSTVSRMESGQPPSGPAEKLLEIWIKDAPRASGKKRAKTK